MQRHFLRFHQTSWLLACLVLPAGVAYGQNPTKLAAQCRIDLLGDPSVGTLDQGAVVEGSGSNSRMTWLDAAVQPRTYSMSADIVQYGWTTGAFRFVPASNGTVSVSLMGPWELDGGGVIYQQEVLWDAGATEGATLQNLSFEDVSGNEPLGWTGGGAGGVIQMAPPTPVDGTNSLIVWHDRRRSQDLAVTGGVPVTIRFEARAALPPGCEDMERILESDTKAHRAARRYMRGVNLGNYLEAPPGQNWGATYDSQDFQFIREEGFDHVRIPIRWSAHAGPGPGFIITNGLIQQADFLVTNALERGLGVIVNMHHYEEMNSDPSAESNKFYRLWEQIATHYRDMPEAVVLELLNEPNQNATTIAMQPIYTEAIRRIRVIDPDRTLFVGPGNYNSISELANLNLPASDSNLVVTVHNYSPFLFTHQGASWALPDSATTGIPYPGPPPAPITPAPGVSQWVVEWIDAYNTTEAAYNPCRPAAFSLAYEQARNWSDYYGRPVHVGEFGCYDHADPVSRVRYYRDARASMDSLGLGWAMWDWKAGFRYWEDGPETPYPGMRDAMFPAPKIASGSIQGWTASGSAGRTYVVERSTNPVADVWNAMESNELESTVYEYSLPGDPSSAVTFFRVSWQK